MRSSKSFTDLFQLEDGSVRVLTGGQSNVKRKYVQLVTNTGVRRLLIPQKRTTCSNTGVVDQEKLDQIRADVKEYMNPESKLEKALRIVEEKERRARESEARKQSLEQCARRCKTAGTGRDKIQMAEEFQRDNLLISRAIELQREREDEMKLCNSLLLMSKCQTIRDAQVAEKTLIAKELKAVELDLDRIMEEDRMKAIEEQDKLREQEEIKKKLQFQSLTKQIQLNKDLREMAVYALEKETRRLRQVEENRQKELENKKKLKLMEQEKRKREIEETNQALRKLKEEQKEQKMLMNLKIQNILKEKIEAEEQQEREKKQIQLLRDKEFARLERERKRNDVMAELQYDMKCRQVQEECDREWRRRELEEQRKRKQMMEELVLCRKQQEAYRRQYQAVEQEKCDAMNTLLERQREADVEKEREKQRQAKQRTLEYGQHLQKLMEEKQAQKKKLHESRVQDGRRLRQEQQNRIDGLKSSIGRKIIQVR
ncbi:cilia- and flagella-associated protein 45-like [Diaphorina citri]|uniref:Cilia- and flagella-associated protein 45 n=1 Tax=Diaphorina citri TaxID=121845 RepID=A0A1S4ER25_DIACI|nr:cilia- and flagella-associated protein 45-like [Diaphorina citri]